MAKVRIVTTGVPEFKNMLTTRHKAVTAALPRALTEEVQIAFRISQQDVPVRTGVLKNSGAANEAREIGKDRFAASITYGGAASAYAARQNNDRSLNHPRGGKAGFATDPILLRLSEIQAGILRRVKKALTKP